MFKKCVKKLKFNEKNFTSQWAKLLTIYLTLSKLPLQKEYLEENREKCRQCSRP